MALETPNAIAAAIVIDYDADAEPGSQFSIVSSSGILAKLAEGLLGSPPFAAFSFEYPITSAEAVVTGNFQQVGGNGGDTFIYAAGFQIKNGPVNEADYDALPDGCLVCTMWAPNEEGVARVSTVVIRIPRG